MKKRIVIKYRNKKIKVTAKDCNFLKKFTGLMFSRREKAEILLFNFRNRQKIAIHSFFVFYPFLAVWIDERNKVIDVKKIKPFVPFVSPSRPSVGLVEIPLSKKYQKIYKKFG